jgi:hypothetical protein
MKKIFLLLLLLSTPVEAEPLSLLFKWEVEQGSVQHNFYFYLPDGEKITLPAETRAYLVPNWDYPQGAEARISGYNSVYGEGEAVSISVGKPLAVKSFTAEQAPK